MINTQRLRIALSLTIFLLLTALPIFSQNVIFKSNLAPASASGTDYVITYSSNSNQHQPGVVTGAVPPQETRAAGTLVTVASNSGNLSRQGFTFAGWNTLSDGSGTTYSAGSGTFTISSNITLYAKWDIPSSARLLANSSETSSVVSITNPDNVTNGNSCISNIRGITSDGSHVFYRPSGALGYICKVTMGGVVVSVLNVPGLNSVSGDKLDLTYSKGCIFIQPSANDDNPPDYVGNSTIYCIDLSDSTLNSINLPTSYPLFPGRIWLNGNLIDFPDGRIGAVSKPYTPEQYLVSGADTSTITSCPPMNFCKVLRLYTLTGSGKSVVPTWSEDMVIAEGDDWPDDDHGIATDGTYLYQTNYDSGYRVYALRSGALSYTVFNGVGTGDGTTCGASTGISGRLCLINYPVDGSNSAGKVLSNNTYWGRNHTTNQYLNGDYSAARFWVSGSATPPAGPGSSPPAATVITPQISSCPLTTITSISPLGGPSSGGTRVTISGQGLSPSVYIAGRLADLRLASSTSVTVITPAGSKGSATIRIDGCGSSASTTYLYDPDPVISSLSSLSISTSGGSITITGSFLSGASLSLDGARALLSTNTDEKVIATLPPSTPGEKTLTLSTSFGSASKKLNYISPPSLAQTLPSNYIAQGDLVSLSFATAGANTYSSSGTLPAGLSLNIATGLLTGTASKEGIYNFSITASNEVGSDTKSYTIDIDRPAPKAISSNIYFSTKVSALSATNHSSLDRLVNRINAIAPRNLAATITISGGNDTSQRDLTILRHDQVKKYLEASGIRIKSFTSIPGSPNKIGVTASWVR